MRKTFLLIIHVDAAVVKFVDHVSAHAETMIVKRKCLKRILLVTNQFAIVFLPSAISESECTI